MLRLRARLLAFATCSALATVAFTQQVASGSTAQASSILADMQAAYAAVDAFEATGWARSEATDIDGVTRPTLFEERDFHAMFSAPDQLCFSMVHLGSQNFEPWTYMLSIEGMHVSPVEPGQPEDGPSAISRALSGSAGITSCAVPLLTGLLLPYAGSGYRLADLKDVRVEGEDVVGDVRCLRVVGRFRQRDYTFWVSTTDHFVRRCAYEYSGGVDLCRDTIEFVRLRMRPKGYGHMQDLPCGRAQR